MQETELTENMSAFENSIVNFMSTDAVEGSAILQCLHVS